MLSSVCCLCKREWEIVGAASPRRGVAHSTREKSKRISWENVEAFIKPARVLAAVCAGLCSVDILYCSYIARDVEKNIVVVFFFYFILFFFSNKKKKYTPDLYCIVYKTLLAGGYIITSASDED